MDWSPPAWNVVGEAGPGQRTPDLATIVEEITGRDGWSSGQALTLFISGSGERVAEAFDGSPSAAPLLQVEYTLTSEIHSFETRVATATDDAEESSGGRVQTTSSDLELVFTGGRPQWVGIRFQDVQVPAGSIIERAYLQFQVDETSSEPCVLLIQGERNSNPSGFTTARRSISDRPPTDSSVAWMPPPWTTVGSATSDQQTPDLSTVIQEIIDQSGWHSGNALAISVSGSIGTRTAESFNGQPGGAPLLHIDYRPPSR